MVGFLETTVRVPRHFGRVRSLTVITIADLRAIAQSRIDAMDTSNSIHARPEGDLGLTDLEQHVLADLLSDLRSSPFIRRILRKLALS